MKTFRIFVVVMAICMFMTGCGKHTTPTSTVPSGVTPAATTEDPNATQNNGNTETTSQGNTNSGTAGWTTSDSRITPVNIDDYWISDNKFDFVNYCRDQGADPKYLVRLEDGSNVACQPEELSSYQGELIAIGALYYFGGEREYVYVYCQLGIPESYWVKIDNGGYEVCQDLTYSSDDDVSIVIDDFGNTLSLSTINHLPIIFEYMMTLPRNTTAQEAHNVFNAHYHDND